MMNVEHVEIMKLYESYFVETTYLETLRDKFLSVFDH